jgi:hypothetical protein
MANTVFIPGAGASYQAGVPLMNDFLDVAYSLWRTGEAKDFDSNLFRYLGEGAPYNRSIPSLN